MVTIRRAEDDGFFKMRLSGIVELSLLLLVDTTDSKVVQTRNVPIQGGKCESTEVNYFFSIPYAKPPVGELRYAPPQPPSVSFRGVTNATKPTPSCIQFGTQFAETGSQSEDCLYLNIWAPASATPESNLPVKVWLYGGSNEGGGVSNPTYDGCYSALDSVVVSINYRLGPLGFLALSDLGLTGNYGIMDQKLGLEWVQENIRSFGGDPVSFPVLPKSTDMYASLYADDTYLKTKVLLFGESAGAVDGFVLATLPEATALMRAAALESGGGRDLATVADAQVFQKMFLDKLNCSTPDLACLQAASPTELQAAFQTMPAEPVIGIASALNRNGSRSAWGPLVDEAVIPKQPSAVGLQVPSIIGSNSDEGTFFVLGRYGEAASTLTQSDYDEFLTFNFGPLASRVNETFSLDTVFNGSVAAALVYITTDMSYKCPAHRALLRANGKDIPVWSYRFAHAPSCPWFAAIPEEYLSFLGATHTSEIPFVFNMTHNMPPPEGNCTFSEAEQEIARTMSRAWTNMAEFGTPDDDTGTWPAWTADKSMGVKFKDGSEVTVVEYESCAFWNEINDALNEHAAAQ
ncbi:hypothetical protein DL770_000821 [Monosporascus sp. CRB-9-2]|nr:hypothetical protein DL770_000821 [Monosporascus sp. CRB-9-2]